MIIYEANETDFFSNGLGTLPGATSALVTEERNGEFVLDVIYPQQGLRSELLTKNRIIKADAGHELKDQRFVIKKVTPTMDSDGYIYLTVHAEHVSYITADLGVTPNLTLSGNATQALEQWQANLVGGHPDITVDSDIISTHETSLDITKATNARQVLGGVEGSILDVWGGEYKFDNLHISLRGQRGTTANTLISYGRNLLTFEQEDDITDTYTSIYPYANVGLADGNNSKLVTVDGYFVDSQYVDRYPNRKLLPVDFGSEFTDYKIGSKSSESDSGIYTTEVEIKKKLTELAKQYIENNRIGIPKVSTKITFADLSKTSEYAPLEQVNLCDIIPIRFEKLGIDTTIKVTRVVWNVLLDEYDSIELGDLRTTLGESISALESKTTGLASAVITAQSTADNQNSIFRTNGGTAEPVAKKTGDLWFKTDGDYQYMYQWDGAVWHEVVNTKTTDDIAKKVDQARAKMEELVKKANNDTTIFQTEGQEAAPTAKKKGDLWFKTDNGQTVMHEWDGQKWHEVVNTKDNSDLKAHVVDISSEMERAKKEVEAGKKRLDANEVALAEAKKDLDLASQDLEANRKEVAKAQADVQESMKQLAKQEEKLTAVKSQADEIATNQSETAKALSDRIESVSSQAMADAQNLTNQLSQAQDTLNAKILDAQSALDGKISTVNTDLTKKISAVSTDLDAKAQVISGIQQDLTAKQKSLDSLSKQAQSQGSAIGTLQSDVTGIKGQYADLSSNVNVLQADTTGLQADMKDAKGNISSLSAKASGLEQKLKDANGNITTIQTDVKGLKSTVSQKVDNATYTSFVEQTKNNFSVTVGKIDSLNVGATNLIKGTHSEYGGLLTSNGYVLEAFFIDDITTLHNLRNVPMIFQADFAEATNGIRIEAWYQDSNDTRHGIKSATYRTISGHAELKITVPNTKIKRLEFIISSELISGGKAKIKCEKLERGTIATDWSPAPEDTDASIADLTSKYSSLKVDTDGIHTQVGEIVKNVDGVKGRVSSAETSIEQNKKAIELKSNKTDVDKLSGRVSSAEANLTVAQGEIQSKASKTEVDSLSGRVKSAESTLKQTADGLELTNQKLDGLRVGGRNLITNTHGSFTDTLSSVDYVLESFFVYDIEKINSMKGNSVIFSTDFAEATNGIRIEAWYQDSNDTRHGIKSATYRTISGHAELKITVPNTKIKRLEFIISSELISGGKAKIKCEKLERGTIATNWSPAPEDVDSQLTSLSSRITANSNEFSSVYNRITSLGDRTSSAESKLKQTADGLELTNKQVENIKGNLNTLSGKVTANNKEFGTVYTKINQAKDDAVNTIKGDSKWNALGNIITNSSFLQTADGFALQVSKQIVPAIDNIQIGGRNLLQGTHAEYTGLLTSSRYVLESFFVYDIEKINSMKGNSVIFSTDFAEATNGIRIEAWYQDSNDTRHGIKSATYRTISGHAELKITVPNTKIKRLEFIISSELISGGKAKIRHEKLERGNKPTDWTPAPEDLAAQVALNKVIDTADSHTRTITNYLTGENSQFKQLQNAINLRVQKGDLLSEINLQAGSTLIRSKHLYLDSDTVTFSNRAFIPSAVIQEINANLIKAGTLDVAKIGVLNFTGEKITGGEINGQKVKVTNLRAENINSGVLDANKVTIKNLVVTKDTFIGGTLDASVVNVTNLNASHISTGVLDAHQVRIDNLKAEMIKSGTLNAAKLNVINLNANSINAGTLSGAHLHITKDSYIENASIDGAKIKSLDASKITTGTLDAANVKVINLDANNIRTGTLTGPGMALDLNNGSFKINNSDNSLKVEMDSGELRFYRQRNAKALTGTISASDWAFLSDDQQALNLTGQDGVILKTENFKMTNLFMTSGWFLTTADAPSSNGSAVILHNNDVKIIGQTNSQALKSRITLMTGKPYTCKLGGVTSVEYTGIDIIGSEDQSGVVDINGGNEVRISGSRNKINLNLGGSSLVASVANSSNYDDTTRKSEITMREDAIYFNFTKDKEDLTPLALYNGGTVRVKDLSVWGSKNAIVQTTAGWTKINAFETAEYYFGDLGTAVTDDTSTVRIGIEPLFNETVNTNIPYQVFVTAYGEGYAWVAERGSNYFVIKSSVPNLEIGYEIKAKRKGYENVRLEIDEHMEVSK